MERLIDKVREKYPSPRMVSQSRNHRDKNNYKVIDYCVGGALLGYLGSGYVYPLPVTLYNELRTFGLNPTKDEAYDIVHLSDSGNFEASWEIAAQILERGRNVKAR